MTILADDPRLIRLRTAIDEAVASELVDSGLPSADQAAILMGVHAMFRRASSGSLERLCELMDAGLRWGMIIRAVDHALCVTETGIWWKDRNARFAAACRSDTSWLDDLLEQAAVLRDVLDDLYAELGLTGTDIDARLQGLHAGHHADIDAVIAEHLPGSSRYAVHRDWPYATSDIWRIADLSYDHRRILIHRAEEAGFGKLLRPIAEALFADR